MLKTNSKQARENIRAYILNHYDPAAYDLPEPQTFREAAAAILENFRAEKFRGNEVRYYHGNEYAAFSDWCAGLPSLLDTYYFYNRSAVDDLGAVLEETEQEKARFTEQDAESRLTWLIYRELVKGC